MIGIYAARSAVVVHNGFVCDPSPVALASCDSSISKIRPGPLVALSSVLAIAAGGLCSVPDPNLCGQ